MAAVDIWTISLTQARDDAALSPDELARAARFRFDEDRTRWTRARAALRHVLATYLNTSATGVAFTAGPHGKPYLHPESRFHFNLSHAGDYALIAVSETTPVGIDIERIRPTVDIAALLRRLSETDLPDTLPELFHRWTQREARSKAAGGELFAPPRAEIIALDIPAPEGYAASVACAGSPLTIRHCPGEIAI